jgi:hypothetical protein
MAWLTRVGAVSDRGAVPCMGVFALDDLMTGMAGFSNTTVASSGS